MRVAIPHLREHGGGRIVNLSSASSIVPEPLMGIYNASKAALDNLTETLRFELSPQDIGLKLMSYNRKLWMRDLKKGATYPPS
jgi:short-subunit dehydrogenase